MKQSVYLIQAPPSWLKTPPLWLLFLKSYLNKKKVNLEASDLNRLSFQAFSLKEKKWLGLNQNWEKNLFGLIEKNYPALLEKVYRRAKKSNFIGFSLLKRNLPFSFSLAQKIKKLYPNKKIIFGGPQTLFLSRENKLNQKDYWVIGEGEVPLDEITRGSSKKKYFFNQLADLDSLPFYDLDPLYPKNSFRHLPLFSSRGCKFNCNFCTERLLYKKFRSHSPAYIADQINYLNNKYQVEYFTFSDSFLNYSYRWLEEFCRRLAKSKTSVKWEAQFRVDKNFPLSLAKMIKKSGCYNLFVGLESGANKILELMNKGFQVEDALTFFKTLNKAGLFFEISLILGYHQEEKKDFEKTLNFVIKNKKLIPKIAQLNPFVDYLKKESQNENKEGKKKVNTFLKALEKEKIPYTKSYINNLIY